MMSSSPTASLEIPSAIRTLLEGRSDDAEVWLLAVETGTRLEGAPGRPWAWFCVSDRRAVLACAVVDSEVAPLWTEFATAPTCVRSRVGRDAFGVLGAVAFEGPLTGGAALRFAAEISGLNRADRLLRLFVAARDAGESDRAHWLLSLVQDASRLGDAALHRAALHPDAGGAHRYDDKISSYTQAAIALSLRPAECLLATLETSTPATELDVPWVFVLTDQRCWLTAAAPDGAIATTELAPARALTVTDEVGRDPVTCAGHAWRTTFGNEKQFQEVAPVPALTSTPRLVEMARLHKLHAEPARAAGLLGIAVEREPTALPLALRALARGAGIHGALAVQVMCDQEPEAMARELARWGYGTETAEQIVSACLTTGDARAVVWTLPLQREIYKHRIAATKDPRAAAAMRLSHARSLLNGGERIEAQIHAEGVLVWIPAATLADLVADEDTDGWRSLRTGALRLLEETGHVRRARVELAGQDPLSLPRIDQLAELDEPIGARARLWSQLLTGDLEPRSAPVADPPPPADAASLEHPLVARSAAWERVQTFLATQAVPDTAALRAYCQPLGRSASEAAVRALADATIFLGVPAINAYVSRGERRRGVRAFDGDPPFVLVGADHIDGDGDVDMTESELRFALCAEAAHIRMGHVRITSGELWSGIWDKSWSIADFALALTPAKFLEKPIGAIGKGLPLLQRVGLGSVQEAVDYAGQVAGRLKPGGTSTQSGAVGPEHRELLGMARALQLSADRAGLAFCGDLRSAVRAIFLSSPALLPVLEVARRQGLGATLSRRSDDGSFMYPELALRLGALAGFWMSDAYAELRDGLLYPL